MQRRPAAWEIPAVLRHTGIARHSYSYECLLCNMYLLYHTDSICGAIHTSCAATRVIAAYSVHSPESAVHIQRIMPTHLYPWRTLVLYRTALYCTEQHFRAHSPFSLPRSYFDYRLLTQLQYHNSVRFYA